MFRYISTAKNFKPKALLISKFSDFEAYHIFIQYATDRIAVVLKKYNVYTVFSICSNTSQFFTFFKDKLPTLQTQGVYSIPLFCGTVYIAKTGRSIST